jgi:hypothetical protein
MLGKHVVSYNPSPKHSRFYRPRAFKVEWTHLKEALKMVFRVQKETIKLYMYFEYPILKVYFCSS